MAAEKIRGRLPRFLDGPGVDPLISAYLGLAWPKLGIRHRPQVRQRLHVFAGAGKAPQYPRRPWIAADGAVRTLAPLALELAGISAGEHPLGPGLPEPAEVLRSLQPLDPYSAGAALDVTRVLHAFVANEYQALRRAGEDRLAVLAGLAQLTVKAAHDATQNAYDAEIGDLSHPDGGVIAGGLRQGAGGMAGEAWGLAYLVAAQHIVPWGTDAVDEVAGAGLELLDRLITT